MLFTDKIFEILPSKEIVVEKGGDVTVTCRYNEDCDASLHKKEDPLNLVKKLTRLNISNNDIKELTWEYVNVQKAYGGVYFCELTNCTQYANNGKKSFEILVRGKLSDPIKCMFNDIKDILYFYPNSHDFRNN